MYAAIAFFAKYTIPFSPGQPSEHQCVCSVLRDRTPLALSRPPTKVVSKSGGALTALRYGGSGSMPSARSLGSEPSKELSSKSRFFGALEMTAHEPRSKETLLTRRYVTKKIVHSSAVDNPGEQSSKESGLAGTSSRQTRFSICPAVRRILNQVQDDLGLGRLLPQYRTDTLRVAAHSLP